MKINFDDGGYIETSASDGNKVFITIAAPSAEKPSDMIINSAEITKEQLNNLLSEFKKKTVVEQPVDNNT